METVELISKAKKKERAEHTPPMSKVFELKSNYKSKMFDKETLSKHSVKDLRAKVKEHNLHNVIKNYSKMKKADLVQQLVKHGPKQMKSNLKQPKAKPKVTFGNNMVKEIPAENKGKKVVKKSMTKPPPPAVPPLELRRSTRRRRPPNA